MDPLSPNPQSVGTMIPEWVGSRPQVMTARRFRYQADSAPSLCRPHVKSRTGPTSKINFDAYTEINGLFKPMETGVQ